MRNNSIIFFCIAILFHVIAPRLSYAVPTLQLVKDFYDGDNYDYTLSDFTIVGNVMFFKATIKYEDRVSHAELWKTDGSAAGTVMVKEFNNNPTGNTIGALTPYNNILYFQGIDDTHGQELWKSDGTTAGTVMVKDLNPGYQDGFYYRDATSVEMVLAGGILYFRGDENAFDFPHSGLCRSDGTAAGTYQIFNFDEGPKYLTSLNDTILFSAEKTGDYLPEHAFKELYKSDGTTAGTILVKDIYPGVRKSSSPINLTTIAGTVFFKATDETHGQELWRSTGTTASTEMVADIANFSLHSNPEELTKTGGYVMFSAYDEVSGRELVASLLGYTADVIDINKPAWDPTADSNPQYLTTVNNTLYFAATRFSEGRELWKSDGTASGTELVKDICTTPYTTSNSDPTHLLAYDGKVVFSASDCIHGIEFWISDGTVNGTYMLDEIGVNFPASHTPIPIIVFKNSVYLTVATGLGRREKLLKYGEHDFSWNLFLPAIIAK